MQIQAVNPNFTPRMEAHTLENDMELNICSPYYPHINAYDISAYNSLNQLLQKALSDEKQAANPNFTPQMKAHILENDLELKDAHFITPM